MNTVLETILLVVAILLIVIVLLRGNKATDAGSVITGGQDALFQNMKERGVELFITRFTFALGVIFFIISLILFLEP